MRTPAHYARGAFASDFAAGADVPSSGRLGTVKYDRMASLDEVIGVLPERLVRRLRKLEEEVDVLGAKVHATLETQLPASIAFRFEHAAIGDVLTAQERAQSVSFVTRYEALPVHYSVKLAERDGHWYITNLPLLRYILNDYRPLIQNQRDVVHYQKIHSAWYKFLRRPERYARMLWIVEPVTPAAYLPA
jgi:hypothetical protein